MEGQIFDRRQILEMIKSHQISADEGMRLIGEAIKDPNKSSTVFCCNEWERSEVDGNPDIEFDLTFVNPKTGVCVLILDVDEGFYSAVKERFAIKDSGSFKLILVKPGEVYKNKGNSYEIRPGNEEDYRKLIRELNDQGLTPQKIIHMWSKEEFTGTEKELTAQLGKGIYSMFFLTKALMEQKPQQETGLIYVYTSRKGLIQPQYAALSGFTKTVNLENPRITCKTIEIRSEAEGNPYYDLTQMADVILREFQPETDKITEVRFENGIRFVKKLKEIDLSKEKEKPLPLKDGGTYLITGGSGGLGYIFAEFLARRVKARLVLVSRSGITPELENGIKQLEKKGAEVVYLTADISYLEDVKVLIKETKKRFKDINGIIHSAGVIRDSFLINKNTEEVAEVLAPKVFGTVWLDELTKEEPLDFFILFSSMAAVMGNAGQSDYAFGNSFMDNFAELRERWKEENSRAGKTLSINWSLWREGGMTIDKQTENLFLDTIGLKPLEKEMGLEAFTRGLVSSYNQLAVAAGDTLKLRKWLGFKGTDAKTVKLTVQKVESGSPRPESGSPKAASGAITTEPAVLSAIEIEDGFLLQSFQSDLLKLISKILKTPEQDLNLDQNMTKFGFDSITFTELANKINSTFKIEITPTFFFSYTTPRAIAEHLLKEQSKIILQYYQHQKLPTGLNTAVSKKQLIKPAADATRFNSRPVYQERNKEADVNTSFSNEPVAIIGMSGVMPQSPDLEMFWRNLEDQKNLVTEIPKDRWDWKDFYGDPFSEVNKTDVIWGGFMTEVDKFDPLFFSISPHEAELMDPQQRIFLEMVWHAIEDAGYRASDLAGTKTALFVGVASSEYLEIQKERGLQVHAQTPTGVSHALLTNRISYLLDIHGPSEPVDAACASSLVAIHRAVEEIQKGNCVMAIAGGVNVMVSPTIFISNRKAGMLSPDGKARTFDKEANGYVRGEGSGAILLKPLSKALSDGDHIYAVIKGTAINHGGRGTSLTAPNSDAQVEVLKEAYKKANFDPTTVSYIEAHGTGTKLGDPVEVDSLKRAFKDLYNEWGKPALEKPHCGLGSVKTNIGHLEGGAGIAGILKVLLAMKNRMLPGTIHLTELNPYIKLEGTPFYVVENTKTWEAPKDEKGNNIPRRAGVSCFGFGGVNAHVVLEEYGKPTPTLGGLSQEPQVIVFSAKNEERLLAYAKKMIAFLEKNSAPIEVEQTDLDKLYQYVQDGLLDIASEVINVGKNDIDIDENLDESGFDLVLLAKFVNRINEKYNLGITASLFTEFKRIRVVAMHLIQKYTDILCGYYCNNVTKKVKQGNSNNHLLLSDLAYTLQVGREPMEERLALVVSSIDELIEGLSQYCQGKTGENNLYRGNAKTDRVKIEDLVRGRAGKEFLKAIVEDGELNKLAQLWVLGINIEWKMLYPEGTPNRIPLPTYPFAKQSYWLPETSPKYGGTNVLHPLLDKIDPGLSLMSHGFVFQKTLKNVDFIVKDHKVQEQPMLPGVGYLEMAYAAAFKIKEDARINLAQVVWLQPLPVQEGKKEVQIIIKEENGRLPYQIESNDQGRTIIHSKGEICFCDEGREEMEQRLSIEEIKGRCTQQIDKETLYKCFKEIGVDYGPYFRGLNQMWSNNEEALGLISLPVEYKKEQNAFTLQPTLMDGAFQVMGGLLVCLGTKIRRPMVPFALEKLEILKPLKSLAYAYVRPIGKNQFNAVIMDENGLVCVKFHNVSVRQIKDPLQDFFYIPRWNQDSPTSYDIQRTKDVAKQETGKTVLMIYSPHSLNIKQALAEMHAKDEIKEIKISSGTKKNSEQSMEIRTDDTYTLDDCIRELSDIHIIYFLGGIQSLKIDIVDLDALDESQERGALFLFRLIKSLAKHGFNKQPIQLKVVTNDVHEVVPGEAIIPYAASLHGLAKSAAKEYPEWKISCIDISLKNTSASTSKDEMRALVKPIVDEADHLEVRDIAVRNGKRYVQVIEPIQFPEVSKAPFKHRGVYLILGGAGGIGLELGRYLSITVQARLVLIGRSELSADQKEKIDWIESQGGEVLYLRADATDIESMKIAVNMAKARFGSINGVIHSAIVLRDKTLENMGEETFSAVLAPKVRGSVILHKILAEEPLDFMMFFSSAQSFTCNAGQSNYAAACSFKDAFAHYLNEIKHYPVKIINWSYWGSIGIVATEEYNKRLAALGVQSIKPEEGLEAVRRLLGHRINQIITLKADRKLLEMIGVDLQRQTELYPENIPSALEIIVEQFKPLMSAANNLDKFMRPLHDIEKFGSFLLLNVFRRMGVFRHDGEQHHIKHLREQLRIIPSYFRLFEALLDVLARSGFIKIEMEKIYTTLALENPDLQNELESIESKKAQLISAFPEFAAYVNLLWTCLKAYPEILTGEVSHMQVMFPEGAKSLLENLYKGNELVDYHNRLVAQIIKSYIKLRLQKNPMDWVNILEVGAGTGGTSVFVLKDIKEYSENIQYFYTDISVGFTQYGRETYGNDSDFMEFKLLNIEKLPEEQGFEPNSFDVVFGSNVLHATKQINNTLLQAKRLLKTNGLLIINELTKVQDFATLTFGLTDGWWLFEDDANRLKGSPLLGPGKWKELLKTNGFNKVEILGFPGTTGEQLSQSVILGESDGIVNVKKRSETRIDSEQGYIFEHKPQKDLQKPFDSGVACNVDVAKIPISESNLKENTKEYIKGVFSDLLKIKKKEIDSGATFERYGVDSLIVLELNKQLERDFGKIPSTLLFENNTIEMLSDYFISEHHKRLNEILTPQSVVSIMNHQEARISEDPFQIASNQEMKPELKLLEGNEKKNETNKNHFDTNLDEFINSLSDSDVNLIFNRLFG